jgi:threonine-phosphate decarboxylase
MDFSVNIPELDYPGGFDEMIKNALLQIRKYPDIDGMNAKKAIAEYNDIGADQIVLGNGATELIYLMSRAIDITKATIVQPTFTEYNRALIQNNVEVSHYYLDPELGFELDVQNLIQHLDDTGSDLLVLCNPNNPTGNLIAMDSVEEILLSVRNTELMVMIDESFMDFVRDYEHDQHQQRINALIKKHSLMVIRSLTKNFMIPGIRIGYAIGSQNMVIKMNQLKEPWTINAFALESIPFLLKQNDYLKALREWCHSELLYLSSNLSVIDGLTIYESAANFLLFRLDKGSVERFMSSMIKGGIYIRPCNDFEGLDHRYFRTTLRKRIDNSQLIKLIKLIMEAEK